MIWLLLLDSLPFQARVWYGNHQRESRQDGILTLCLKNFLQIPLTVAYVRRTTIRLLTLYIITIKGREKLHELFQRFSSFSWVRADGQALPYYWSIITRYLQRKTEILTALWRPSLYVIYSLWYVWKNTMNHVFIEYENVSVFLRLRQYWNPSFVRIWHILRFKPFSIRAFRELRKQQEWKVRKLQRRNGVE